MLMLAAGLCFLQLVATESAAEPELVKLAVTQGKDVHFARLTTRDGLSPGQIRDILQDDRGFLWFNTSIFLNRFDGYEFRAYRRDAAHPHYPAAGFFNFIFKDRSGSLWLASTESLDRFDPITETLVRMPIDVKGHSGLVKPVSHISQDRSGMMWLATDAGLYRLDPSSGALRHYGHDSSDPGSLSSAAVRSTYEDREGTLWVGTAAGLEAFDRRTAKVTERVRIDASDALSVKMLEDRAGLLWIAYLSGNGLASYDRDARRLTYYSFKDREAPATSLTGAEGIHEDTDGNLWLATRGSGLVMFFGSKSGLTSFWPDQIVERPFVAPVVLTQFSLKNVPVPPGSGSVLAKAITYTPSLILSYGQNLFSFEFAALSYVDPKRNRYRYKLEPLDDSWNPVDPDRRIATFTTLPPGSYTLRVQGSNNRGVWNEEGVTLALQILPPWWGTRWFRSMSVVVFLALLWAGYQLRVRHLHHQFEMTLEARVGERTRIARELHDTLLQSFHGLLLRFQTASYLLPDRPAEAKQKLDNAIGYAAKAITEGRDAVQGLRSSTVEGNDLALAIRTLGDELATGTTDHPPSAFRVGVEGHARLLRPIVRDEIYKIAAEALRNSFTHAQAGQVEVEIRYDTDEFRLRVRDDGRGIDQTILAAQGVEGHYGLRGMPERAALIGGKLAVWSEVGAGTEVELRTPASAVYAPARSRSWWSRLSASSMRAEGRGDAS